MVMMFQFPGSTGSSLLNKYKWSVTICMNYSKEGSITNTIFIQASAYLLSNWSTSARMQIIVDYSNTDW